MAAKRKRRAPGDGGLFQRAEDGMWVGSVDVPTYDGKRRAKRVYSKSYATCRAKLKALQQAVEDGYVPTGSTTVAAWLTHWINEIKRPHLKPKTLTYYADSIRLHIAPAIGKRKLDQLTTEDVRQMFKTIDSSYNRKRAHLVLGLALKSAVANGVLRRNVVDAVERPGHLAEEGYSFAFEQAQVIIRTAIEIDEARGADEEMLATLWAASFLSGARPAELLGMEWARLDFDTEIADFSWQLQQLKKAHGCGAPVDGDYPCGRQRPSYCPQAHWDFGKEDFETRDCYKSLIWTRPKTEAGTRIVPIVPGLAEMLRQHRKLDQPNPHGLVWHHADGRPLSPTNAQERWQSLLQAAGITTSDETIRWYSARHSTATMLQAAGVPEEVRMRIMGQSSAAAHQKYIHVDQTQTRAALANLTELLPVT